MSQSNSSISAAINIAEIILDGFDRHFQIFSEITKTARDRFEVGDWEGDNQARAERIAYYDSRVRETLFELRQHYEFDVPDSQLWQQIKLQFMGLLYEHRQPELAESFYNSVFCQLFDRRYYDNQHIFVRPGLATDAIDMASPAYVSYYPAAKELTGELRKILRGANLSLPWQDMERDIARLAKDFKSRFLPVQGALQCQLQVIIEPFFRNKAAYIVGRAIVNSETTGFVIPILRSNESVEGRLYVDALVINQNELAIVFSFTRAYFMINTIVPSAVIDFLSSFLPTKTRADLYTAIGFQKQGKTLFYREFLNHLAHSSDQLVVAPGIEGMVMCVFTLPSFPYVFKVIKDHFAPPKKVDHQTVRDKYQYVKNHDRVGRMADTLEFSQVALPLDRISAELLTKLKEDIGSTMVIEDGYLVIEHLYIERRMVPLNLFIDKAHKGEGSEELEQVMIEYGNSIKEMAKANVFPGDMLLKNFGVTRQNRVIFYDYDELQPMKAMRFRKIPPARTPEQEMASEPWFRIEENDFFPEQFENFVMSHPEVRRLFLKHHADLLDADYWQEIVDNIRSGVRADVFPYRQEIRYQNRYASTFSSVSL